jgi:hypothetical protein
MKINHPLERRENKPKQSQFYPPPAGQANPCGQYIAVWIELKKFLVKKRNVK